MSSRACFIPLSSELHGLDGETSPCAPHMDCSGFRFRVLWPSAPTQSGGGCTGNQQSSIRGLAQENRQGDIKVQEALFNTLRALGTLHQEKEKANQRSMGRLGARIHFWWRDAHAPSQCVRLDCQTMDDKKASNSPPPDEKKGNSIISVALRLGLRRVSTSSGSSKLSISDCNPLGTHPIIQVPAIVCATQCNLSFPFLPLRIAK
ncbi:hypothetical protein QBC34DRAFT_135339 [Podospora aff. communis PSN243]|uniref:Uncharacterized protein n=1 Tax=Podospora aff. communis PSN243 TaxID=3040156 RepID=A0AAV9H687_9PEZI|nr:hypothetical protein QBC34DRAFT_135339 [Podospora aff. communis PSN243]